MVWLPREENVEADNLTNGIFSDFDLGNRVDIQAGTLKFLVLEKLQVSAQDLYKDILTEKEKRSSAGSTAAKTGWARKKLGIKERLKWKSPW